jgi:hypothetical protein
VEKFRTGLTLIAVVAVCGALGGCGGSSVSPPSRASVVRCLERNGSGGKAHVKKIEDSGYYGSLPTHYEIVTLGIPARPHGLKGRIAILIFHNSDGGDAALNEFKRYQAQREPTEPTAKLASYAGGAIVASIYGTPDPAKDENLVTKCTEPYDT